MYIDLERLDKKFQPVLKALSKLAKKLNLQVYLVGGVVRDLLLGRDIFDLDLVVENDAIGLARGLALYFGKGYRRHHCFGTATVDFEDFCVDLATSRKELYTGWAKLPRVSSASLEEDLGRRDFTINALAVSLNQKDYGKLIDWHNGFEDLKKGLLRVLHPKSFLEDPLRILRAIRFEQRFSFKIEPNTFKFLKEAIRKKALSLVHPHRLRDELILVLKEPRVFKVLKRIDHLTGLSFLHPKIKLKDDDFKLILRIEKAIFFYQKNFPKHRKLETWLIYLSALIFKLPKKQFLNFIHTFSLRKGERLRLLSLKDNLVKTKSLNNNLSRSAIFELLNALSFETIIFFYAYYPYRKLRKNIFLFLDKLVNIRLLVKGEDLKKAGIFPTSFYGEIFRRLLRIKLDKGIKHKEEELKIALEIFERLKGTKSLFAVPLRRNIMGRGTA